MHPLCYLKSLYQNPPTNNILVVINVKTVSCWGFFSPRKKRKVFFKVAILWWTSITLDGLDQVTLPHWTSISISIQQSKWSSWSLTFLLALRIWFQHIPNCQYSIIVQSKWQAWLRYWNNTNDLSPCDLSIVCQWTHDILCNTESY